MTAGPKTAILALVLCLGATEAVAADYRAEILEQVIRPCFVRLADRHPGEGVSPEAVAEAMMTRHAKELAALIESINGQLESDPPAVARRQIYRIALRACIRQGAVALGLGGSPPTPSPPFTPSRATKQPQSGGGSAPTRRRPQGAAEYPYRAAGCPAVQYRRATGPVRHSTGRGSVSRRRACPAR